MFTYPVTPALDCCTTCIAEFQSGPVIDSTRSDSSYEAIGQLSQYACFPALPSAIAFNSVVKNKFLGSNPGNLRAK